MKFIYFFRRKIISTVWNPVPVRHYAHLCTILVLIIDSLCENFFTIPKTEILDDDFKVGVVAFENNANKLSLSLSPTRTHTHTHTHTQLARQGATRISAQQNSVVLVR